MRPRLILAVLLACLLVGVVWFAKRPAPAPKTSQTTVSPTPRPDPRTVAAVRAHPTPGGPVTVERELEPRGGCRTFIASYPSDGFKVYTLISQPPGDVPAGGLPVVILAHGYISPAAYQTAGSDYQDFINRYCQAGFLVFKPDYRGHGNSEGPADGAYFSAGYTYDVLNLAASLKTVPAASPGRIGLVGHSMGGQVVLRAAVAPHGLPVKAVVFAAGVVGSLEDVMYGWTGRPFPSDLPPTRTQMLAQIGSPQQNPGFWHDASAINYAADITAAVQIHHGDADEVVPPGFSRHLDSALTGAKKAHETYFYPEGDHQFTLPAQRSQFLERSIALFQAKL